MIKIKLNDTTINILLGGYITRENIDNFVSEYKSILKDIKPMRYTLVIEPKEFDSIEDEYIKKVFKMFLKSGFKKIYVLDIFGITNDLKLSKLEKNFFMSKVKIVSSLNELDTF